MRLTIGDLEGFGEDAGLIHFIDTAFFTARPAHVGVAVSGGGDSMALLHLAWRWGQAAGMPVSAVTVNHGLRPEAADEAAMVAEFCTGLGVAHSILEWDGAAAAGNLAAAGREARYALMAEWARAKGVEGLLLGHTQDDVAETFLMRLGRSSGVDGLSLMDTRFERHGMLWARPFWQQSRVELREYLRRHEVPWVEDPTNEDMTRERPKARAALAALAPLGITAERLKDVALAQLSARVALEHYTLEEARRILRIEGGDVVIERRPRPPVPPEIERRLRIGALRFVGGGDYPPRQSALVDLEAGLATKGKHTVGGCLVTQTDAETRFTREYKAVARRKGPTTEVWDGRWELDGPHAEGQEVRALGDAVKDTEWRASGLPRDSLRASPAIWEGETLISAPLVEMKTQDNPIWTARIVTSFGAAVLSR